MFIAIVRHTPIWVWGLLAMLIALGLWQTRDREMSSARATTLPLVMLALSLSGVLNAFGHSTVAVAGWAVGLAAALALGRKLVAVRGAAWSQQAGRLYVPGSWLPLVLIVGLFSIKYLVGASLALHPALATDTAFTGSVGLAYGAFSGLFLTRGLSLRHLAKHPGRALAA